jgi:pimeloyl-ACP methyl ester carboxylesterase
MMRRFIVTGADGTAIRGETNGGDGPDVLLCNGLGAPLVSWPSLAGADSGFRVHTWDYRGLGGSARPSDPARITVADHVDDAVALMDHTGLERAVVASWSIGVNVAFELAERHPDRVSGLLAVAGVPGGTFAAMFGPLRGSPARGTRRRSGSRRDCARPVLCWAGSRGRHPRRGRRLPSYVTPA